MILNKYRYLFIDGSFYVKKNNYILWKKWIESGKVAKYDEGEVIRMMLYSLNKLINEIGGTDKAYILWDSWSADVKGYYRTDILKGLYKDNRTYVSEDDLKKPDLTEEDKEALKDELIKSDVQRKAKSAMIDLLGNYGVPNIRYYGYECDDLVWIYSSMLANDTKRSAFASSDSDWSYLGTTPNTDVYKIGVRGAKSELITYDDMLNKMPEKLKGIVSLYDYKAYYDSIEGSHNNMRRTRKDHANTDDIILELVKDEDMRNLKDPDLFRLQYSTFKVERFPGFNKIIEEFNSKMKMGKVPTLDEAMKFSNDLGMGISVGWMTKFINKFDSNLYEA